MKRIALLALAVTMIAALVAGASTAFAAKPQDVIARSNGFPSGEHFNLNIHGKNWVTCQATEDGGGSVFVPEYGDATIQYVTNKKSSVGNLTVLDPCAGFNGPNDVAKVQLPYEAEGYYVFGRILGKPDNGESGNESSIILYPNLVKQACNDDLLDPDFGDYTSCDLALGLIVGTNLYAATPQEFIRFYPTASPGKGNSQGIDITRLFTYTGWVVHESLDIYPAPDGDGAITKEDIPLGDYDSDPLTPDNRDYNNDGNFDDNDLNAWLTDMSELEPPMAWYFEDEWIFNIADLVVTEQGLVNDGTKLLQIRFYPVDTTEFIQQ